MRVTVIHEWLTNLAGSEKVVLALLDAFPDADVHTSLFEPAEFPSLDPARVHPSWLDRVVSGPSGHTRVAPLLPLAMRSLRVPAVDVAITSFHNFALAAPVPAETTHVVYCHTPTRFVHARRSMADERGLGRAIGTFARGYGRIDRRLGRRGDVWVANSRHIAGRIADAYGHEARVVHPPVDVDRFSAVDPDRGDHFLLVGRLVPYKRADLAIEAFRGFDAELLVVGDGRDRARLEASAPSNVRFLGRVADDELPSVMASAAALVFPGEEDFGITPVEAQAAGTPVVALGRGGVLDSIEPDRTGVLFDEPSPAALREALADATSRAWDHDAIRAHARAFGRDRFIDAFRALVAEVG